MFPEVTLGGHCDTGDLYFGEFTIWKGVARYFDVLGGRRGLPDGHGRVQHG